MSFQQEVQFREGDDDKTTKRKLRLLVEEVARLSKSRSGGGGSSTVDWDSITNKPVTFPPSAHTHSASEVSYNPSGTSLASITVQNAITELAEILAVVTGDITPSPPTALVGTATVPGSAASYMRSDAAPALDQAIVPVWQGNHLWQDNFKVRLGTGADLQVYHDGTDSFITSATGRLIVSGGGSRTEFRQTVHINKDPQTIPSSAIASDATLILADDADLAIEQVVIGGPISAGNRYITAGGTFATPTAINTTDVIYMGYIGGSGYDGTNWQTAAAGLVGIRPAGTWSGTSRPTRISFETTAASSTARTERVRVESNGQLLLSDGTAALPAQGYLSQANTGWYKSATSQVSLAINGAEAIRIDSNKAIRADDGTSVNPGYSFIGLNTMGWYRNGTTTMGWVIGSTELMSLTNNIFTLAGPSMSIKMRETDAAADKINWIQQVNGAVYKFYPQNDAGTAGANWLAATRGSGNNVSDISFGSTTDNPTFTFLGTGILTIPASVDLKGEISPTQLTANTNDWAPTNLANALIIRASTDASRDLTGLTGGRAGRWINIINVGANPLVLKHESGSSTAANRFTLPGAADITLSAGSAIILWYDTTTSRWYSIGRSN